MSARKAGKEELFQGVTVHAQATRLSLSGSDISIRKNGIEFRSGSAIPVWTEMTVELQTPEEPKKLHCTGVVVACTGNRHAGYMVAMLFTNLSRQSQARLNTLVYSR